MRPKSGPYYQSSNDRARTESDTRRMQVEHSMHLLMLRVNCHIYQDCHDWIQRLH